MRRSRGRRATCRPWRSRGWWTLSRRGWGCSTSVLRRAGRRRSFRRPRVATSDVTGHVTVQASALAFANAEFNRLAQAAWAASLPAGFRPLGEPVQLTVPEYLGLDSGVALFRVGVQGQIA